MGNVYSIPTPPERARHKAVRRFRLAPYEVSRWRTHRLTTKYMSRSFSAFPREAPMSTYIPDVSRRGVMVSHSFSTRVEVFRLN